MVAGDIIGAKNFLLLANILNSLRIDKLVIPDVVSMTSPEAILDCQYSSADDRFLLQWFINGSDRPVYQWRPWNEPQVHGVLEGKIDLTYRASTRIMEERRALRLVDLTPELSGEYSCVITADGGSEVRRSGTMMVFSPERDFTLQVQKNHSSEELEVKCAAGGLFPQPELILEHDGIPIRKQVQRVWRNSEYLYDATADSTLSSDEGRLVHKITCRLMLPQAGYMAMKEEHIRSCTESHPNRGSKANMDALCIILIIMQAIKFCSNL